MRDLISRELETGKAGEYLTLYKLLRQGFRAFPSDQGLPYDLLVDVDGRVFRVQVKTTERRSTYGASKDVLRFSTRRARGTNRAASVLDCDFYALVDLEREVVGFFPTESLESTKNPGQVIQTIERRDLSPFSSFSQALELKKQ